MVNHNGSTTAVSETEAIPGLQAWFEGQPGLVQDALRGLGELLMNVPASGKISRIDVFAIS